MGVGDTCPLCLNSHFPAASRSGSARGTRRGGGRRDAADDAVALWRHAASQTPPRAAAAPPVPTAPATVCLLKELAQLLCVDGRGKKQSRRGSGGSGSSASPG